MSKYGPEKTPYLDTFHTVNFTHYLSFWSNKIEQHKSKRYFIWKSLFLRSNFLNIEAVV